VRVLGRAVPAFALGDDRWEAIVGIDLDVKPGPQTISVEAGGARATRELVVKPKTFRTRRLNVDPDFVTPPPSAEAQIEADRKLLARTWESSAAERQWSGPFVRPVKDAANSAFGTRSIFNGVPRNAHGGADFLSPAGTPVHAPNAGRVLVAREMYYSGNTVIIDHGLGLFSMFAHLSAFDTHEGDRVDAGAIVGRVGATGRVTGPHLHWAVRANGARVDPLSLLAVLGKTE
jgi:murein DD-endopeptidase MepM/ murein hydrolase activator NlpD